MKDYRKWMKVRGLPTCGTKEELKAKVLFYTGLPLEQQLQVLPPDYGKAESVMNMLKALVIMLTTILQPTISGELHANVLALRIRMFLNAVEEFEKPLRKKKMKKNKKKRKEYETEKQ